MSATLERYRVAIVGALSLLLVTAGLGFPQERLWRRGEIVKLVLEKGGRNETHA